MTVTTESFSIPSGHTHGTNRWEVTISIDGVRICNATNWAFHSCAAAELKNWNSHFTKPLTDAQVDELLECLKAPGYSSYNPTEYYFMESFTQRQKGFFEKLCSRPEVKLIDSYKNKSHPPNNPVYLWRLSIQKDFT